MKSKMKQQILKQICQGGERIGLTKIYYPKKKKSRHHIFSDWDCASEKLCA